MVVMVESGDKIYNVGKPPLWQHESRLAAEQRARAYWAAYAAR
jgi:hypothetical protein